MSLSQPLQNSGRIAALQGKAAHRAILRALINLFSAALLLRVGGMVNQVVVSASFGAGVTMDTYFVAAAFPLLLVQLMSSAIEAVVIPVYSRLRMHARKEDATRLLSTLLNCLILVSCVLTVALFMLHQQLVFLSAPGLDQVHLDQATALTPLLYAAIPLGLIIGLLESVLNAEGQFGWPAYAGLLVPLTTAVLTLWGGQRWGIAVLCLGSLLGTLLQLAVIFVRTRRARLRYRLVLDVRTAEFTAILHAAWPVLLSAFIIQGGPFIDQIFASTLPSGTISTMSYALKLVSIFSGVLFVSVGRAVMPYLARQAALGDQRYCAFKGTLRLSLWGLGLCSLLISLALFLLAYPLVHVLFQRGAFSANATQQTVIILLGFTVGLVPMALTFLLTRAFNALGETRVPLLVALVSMGANAAFDALFAYFWQGLGITLATSMVYLISCLILLLFLHRRLGALHLWSLPAEILHLSAHFGPRGWLRQGAICWDWLQTYWGWKGLSQRLLLAWGMLFVLAIGAMATAHDALLTLRATTGLLFALCFFRYPYLLLLVMASLNICIGSSLPLFNGNNLDSLFVLSLLLALFSLPCKQRVWQLPGVRWLILYLAWVLLGVGLSPLDTRAFLVLWLTVLASGASGVLTIMLVTTRRRLLGLVDVLVGTALLAALYGLYGYVMHQHGEVDPTTLLFRITSLFTQATTFAFYLCLIIPLAFYRCVFLRGAGKIMYLAIMLCLLAALLFTFTRSAYISIFLDTLVIMCCLLPRDLRWSMVGGLCVLGALAFCLGGSGQLPLLARFFNGDLTTLNGRLYLWQALISRFQITQWLGNGLQSSDQVLAYLRIGSHGQGVIGTAPHSLFLGALYDQGVIGLALVCAVFLAQGMRLLQGICAHTGERRVLFSVALAVLLSTVLQSLGSSDLWIQAVGVPFWIVTALPLASCWSAPALEGEGRHRGSEPRVKSLRVPAIPCFF